MNAPLIIICTFFLFSIYLAIRSKKARRWTMKGGPPVAVATALY